MAIKKFSYRVSVAYGYGPGTHPWNCAVTGTMTLTVCGDTWAECRQAVRAQFAAHWKSLGYDRTPPIRQIDVLSTPLAVQA